MMEDRLQLGMQNNGFQRGDTNVEGIYLFYCLGEQELTIVSVVHAATGTEFEVEQYEHILQQIKESFHSTHLQKIQLLSLLLTGNPDQAKKLVLNAGQDSRWMIDLRTNRLIIYETQSVNFGWLRQMIDQLLTEEEKQKVPYQTEALKVNDNYNADNNAANNENPNRGYHKDSLNGMSTRRSAYRFALAPVTAVIVALNVIAYIISHYLPILGGTENMMDKGALSWYFIKGSHEYYRFLTSMFLHLDWNHLAGNMIIFIFVYLFFEK